MESFGLGEAHLTVSVTPNFMFSHGLSRHIVLQIMNAIPLRGWPFFPKPPCSWKFKETDFPQICINIFDWWQLVYWILYSNLLYKIWEHL